MVPPGGAWVHVIHVGGGVGIVLSESGSGARVSISPRFYRGTGSEDVYVLVIDQSLGNVAIGILESKS